jgi:hypothetical protein
MVATNNSVSHSAKSGVLLVSAKAQIKKIKMVGKDIPVHSGLLKRDLPQTQTSCHHQQKQ